MSIDEGHRSADTAGTPSAALERLLSACGDPMSLAEVRRLLGTSRRFVLALVATGSLVVVPHGGRLGVPKASLIALMRRSRRFRPSTATAAAGGPSTRSLMLTRRAG